jgi:hypothetical protein
LKASTVSHELSLTCFLENFTKEVASFYFLKTLVKRQTNKSSLQKRVFVPTARRYADGQISGPLA